VLERNRRWLSVSRCIYGSEIIHRICDPLGCLGPLPALLAHPVGGNRAAGIGNGCDAAVRPGLGERATGAVGRLAIRRVGIGVSWLPLRFFILASPGRGIASRLPHGGDRCRRLTVRVDSRGHYLDAANRVCRINPLRSTPSGFDGVDYHEAVLPAE
jgi:hypothetical protein